MRLLVICLLAAAAGMVWAPPARADDCPNASSQMDLNICASDSAKKSDAALNAAYGQIMTRLKKDPATTKLLIRAQKAWLAFRDSECAFVASATDGGSANGMIYSFCLDGLTQKRLVELNAYLHCKEGDLSCPVPAQ